MHAGVACSAQGQRPGDKPAQGTRAASAALGKTRKSNPAPTGRNNGGRWSYPAGAFHLPDHSTQGGARPSLALGWLASGRWPDFWRDFQSNPASHPPRISPRFSPRRYRLNRRSDAPTLRRSDAPTLRRSDAPDAEGAGGCRSATAVRASGEAGPAGSESAHRERLRGGFTERSGWMDAATQQDQIAQALRADSWEGRDGWDERLAPNGAARPKR